MNVIGNNDEWLAATNLPKAIIYILVNWSGPERVSRKLVSEVLNTIKLNGVPTYELDCSYGDIKFLDRWLSDKQRNSSDLLCGGWGETLFFENGELKDFIQYPFKWGYDLVKAKIEEWVTD